VAKRLTDQDWVLAIDQGGQSSRVAVYRVTGEMVIVFSAPCLTHTYNAVGEAHLRVEQDGDDILAGIRTCLQKIITALGDDCCRIKAAGFAGQGSSLLCWNNQTGNALSPVLSWQDRRAELLLLALPLTQRQVQTLTGLRISPHYGASKISWCLQHLDTVKATMVKQQLSIGPIASFLFWHLLTPAETKHKIDPGHAQRTLLWNLSTNTWDKDLLSAFDLPETILPTCHWHDSKLGYLTLNNDRVPLMSCQRDQGASLFALGMPEADACYINIGTGAFLQRIADRLDAPDGLLVSPLWFPEPGGDDQPSPRLYAWEATVNGAASAIAWLEDETGVAITPDDIDAALITMPEDAAPDIFYFLNSVGGLSAPYWRTDVAPRFSGDLSTTKKIQAWIESVIFQLMINFNLMQSLGAARRIYISGGLSRSDGVCQGLADLSGVRVHRSDNTDATLQGVAYTAAGMPDRWCPQQGHDLFEPQENPQLRRRFIAWQEAMQRWLIT
jgi:glycerol kinase